jgi:hypothetical protein
MTEPTQDRRSQSVRILSALKRGPITQMDALREMSCLRLAARVHELRMAGHTIISERVESGGKCFARYRLVRRGQA